MARIAALLELLREFPRAGKETALPTMRAMVVAGLPFIVAYQVLDDEILIVGVFHAAQSQKPE